MRTEAPESFAERLRLLVAGKDAFDCEVIEQLGRWATDRIADMPQANLRDRKVVAAEINDAARTLGLAAKCSVSGKACDVDDRQIGKCRETRGNFYSVPQPEPKLGLNPLIGGELRKIAFVRLPDPDRETCRPEGRSEWIG